MSRHKHTFTVQNRLGEEASVTLHVPKGGNPRRYIGLAILKAARVLPNEKPWKAISIRQSGENPI